VWDVLGRFRPSTKNVMRPRVPIAALVSLALWLSCPGNAQTTSGKDEIPLERCDRLPVVTMKVAGVDRRFLLDTGATTILNLNSFALGESKAVQITSWSGTAATSAPRGVFT
jgi:hypothetical protein